MNSFTDKCTGCLMGLAVGDALGTPLDGLKEGHIRQLFGGEVSHYADTVVAFPDRPGKWRLPGLYGFATQQAWVVIDVLSLYGDADVRAMADLYQRLASEGPADGAFGAYRGAGHFFRRTVQALQEGGEPLACGQPSVDAEAAQRIAPIGLYYHADPSTMGHATIRASLLTHGDPRAIAAALAVARATALLVEQIPPLDVAEDLSRWTREWEERLDDAYGKWLDPEAGRDRLHLFSKALTVLPSLVREGKDSLALDTILRQANESEPPGPVSQPNAGYCVALVIIALYRALSARNLVNGLLAAVNAGGEAGTAGAITGALLGARFETEALPEEWVRKLRKADQVALRARAIAEGQPDWSAWENLVEMEQALTAEELGMIAEGRGRQQKAIARREEKLAARQTHKPTASPSDTGFPPPPGVWLRGGGMAGNILPPREEMTPEEARRLRAQRGRKRVEWKEERRRGNKEKPSD